MGFADTQSSQSVAPTPECIVSPVHCPWLRHSCPEKFNPELKPNARPETTSISCTNLLLIRVDTLGVISRYLAWGRARLFAVVDIAEPFMRKFQLFYWAIQNPVLRKSCLPSHCLIPYNVEDWLGFGGSWQVLGRIGIKKKRILPGLRIDQAGNDCGIEGSKE